MYNLMFSPGNSQSTRTKQRILGLSFLNCGWLSPSLGMWKRSNSRVSACPKDQLYVPGGVELGSFFASCIPSWGSSGPMPCSGRSSAGHPWTFAIRTSTLAKLWWAIFSLCQFPAASGPTICGLCHQTALIWGIYSHTYCNGRIFEDGSLFLSSWSPLGCCFQEGATVLLSLLFRVLQVVGGYAQSVFRLSPTV